MPERLVISELEMAGDSQFVTAADGTDVAVATAPGQLTQQTVCHGCHLM
jgi:hypothetical protein